MMTLNHGFSGYVCGRVAMPVLRRYAPVSERALGWAFFLGAMLPDGDVLTRIVVGRGDYFGRAWYSHRQITHSVLGTLLLALLAGAVLFAPVVWRRPAQFGAGEGGVAGRAGPWRRYAWVVGGLWVGGLLHLLGDMATPGRPLPVFWPLPQSYGAWSHIGWFSPYLLWMFLAVLGVDWLVRTVVLNNIALGRGRWRPWAGAGLWLLYAAAAARWLHYLAVSRYVSGAQWAEYQRSLLPEPLVAAATDGVATLWSLIAR
jgi:membrane-bound metal-dependent hydrolase YbcI (DUF457 family)